MVNQPLIYAKPDHLSLKTHPIYNEKWLQERIAEDPSILGLGDLEVISLEKKQDKAGRLDMLLTDADRERRYEVELQLGATDETHIIRCLEYWDIERKRYPQYDHCAVLIAEDITSRFLNVIALFNGHIPMIAMNLNAMRVGDAIVLDFVRIMDRFALRDDDDIPAVNAGATRSLWEQRSPPATLKIADDCLGVVNDAAGSARFDLTYNLHYIGLRNQNTTTTAFIHFKPKKQFTHVLVKVSDPEGWIQKAEDQGMVARFVFGAYVQITLKPGDVEKNVAFLTDLFRQGIAEYDD